MSARDELETVLVMRHVSNARELINALLREHAHELAEKIRADVVPELDAYGTREQQAEIDGRRSAADLIDPEVSDG